MNKQEIYAYLKAKGITFEATEHAPIYTIEEMLELGLPWPEKVAKNLFVRDARKKEYYLIVIREDKRFDLKQFQETYNTRRLGFASEEDLERILQLKRGAVTPLGILNDEQAMVHVYLDEDLARGIIGVHPNENTATVWLQFADLLKLLQDHGNDVHVVSF